MQNNRQRTRTLQFEDLKHNPQFTYQNVGKEQKDIKESDCIDPSLFVEDLTYYLNYYKIKPSASALFHTAQIFEKFNRFEVLRDAPTEYKTKNEYVLFLNINYYFGKQKLANSLFKDVKSKYNITYKDTKEFVESLYNKHFITLNKGNYKTHKSTTISYVGYENDLFFKDESISIHRRMSMLTIFMHIQEDNAHLLYEHELKNNITLKENDTKLCVGDEDKFRNAQVELSKINKKLRKNMSKTAYNFFAYERIFNKNGCKVNGGRLYSSFTQMNTKMRDRILSICSLKEVDMVSSQMHLLYTSSFRMKPPTIDFDFYSFFLRKVGVEEKHIQSLRKFAKLACSLIVNTKQSSIPFMLQSYLANEGLLYSHEEMNNYKAYLTSTNDQYKNLNIDGNIFKDTRIREYRSLNASKRKSRLNEFKSLEGKLTQKYLYSLCYSLPKYIIQYFNEANIKNFRTNVQIVESNSMSKFVSEQKDFILCIHDCFIVEKNSNIEYMNNKFHSYIFNESIRFSKNEITYSYKDFNEFSIKDFNKKIKYNVVKIYTTIPLIYRYIIMDANTKLAFQT